MKRPAGVILAGGQSTRMGRPDKFLMELQGRPILAHVIERLSPQVSRLALNANGDAGRLGAYKLPVISDSISGFAGPLAGVLAGLDWAASEGESHIVTAAADTPFLPADLVSVLVETMNLENAEVVLAATPDPQRGLARQPTFGLWPVALRDDLRQALTDGVRKVLDWTDRHKTAYALFPATGEHDPFFNVNTPEDLDEARSRMAERQA